ncbi:MAG TPA: rhomboid family intramembrane serine protease [Nocardioidaceae bacterium]|nr:rhomboid family intramembrane serine protease [Nocardioidaceae bacterium]
MQPASVGFQCPDCVRQGRRDTRSGLTAFGGRLSVRPRAVTSTLIAINVACFLAAHVSARFLGDTVMQPFAVYSGDYWRLITSTFLHYQVLHILLNMYALWIFGTFAEVQLGRWRFLGLYLVSGFVGSVTVFWFAPLGQVSLGASGAIFGLFGATIVIFRKRRANMTQLLILLALNLVITFTIPNISWQAHVGGLVSGLVIGYAYAYAPRPQRAVVHGGVLVLIFALAVAGVVVRDRELAATPGVPATAAAGIVRSASTRPMALRPHCGQALWRTTVL